MELRAESSGPLALTTSDGPGGGEVIAAFLKTFGKHRADRLEPFLDDDAVYRVDGFADIQGRSAILAYWRRMFDTHTAVRMGFNRGIQDGPVILVAQRQAYGFAARPPIVLESLVVYELRHGQIVSWRDNLDPEDLEPEESALWARLRAARW